MDNYPIRYWAMIALGAIAVITGGISGYEHFTQTPPTWLTPDLGATCAIIAGICGGLVALAQATPGTVAKAFLLAKAGILPKFVADKYAPKVSE